MIQALANRFNKKIAFTLFLIFYVQLLFSASAENHFNAYDLSLSSHICFDLRSLINYTSLERISSFGNKNTSPLQKEEGNNIQLKYSLQSPKKLNAPGPGQPEMSSFQSVNSSDMVDKFSGDFSYNIPLMDVGGYPINIAYRSGITMDQEASWVGLGWNINPGTITRNMRGVPDDFDGEDTITKTQSIRENKTIGGTIGADLEIVGLDVTRLGVEAGAHLGFFHNTYQGWGTEYGLDVSLSSGAKGAGGFTGGLSLTNNSQNGVTVTPSFSAKTGAIEGDDNNSVNGSLSIAGPYNTRSGLQGLELNVGVHGNVQQLEDNNLSQRSIEGINPGGMISFCSPSYTPTISLPYTSTQFSFTGKIGVEAWTFDPNFSASGYVSSQYIAPEDQTAYMQAYGYLHYQDGVANTSALTDFNSEKDMPYRQTPAVPNIGIPSYTYDVFSITGEGIGGMFRAYRGDLGYVSDHSMQTKNGSFNGSADYGFGAILHAGVDVNFNSSITRTGPWTSNNEIAKNISFRQSDSTYEATYFKNPGEMTVNEKSFYNAIGNEDVVAVDLYQSQQDQSTMLATNYLDRYKNKRLIDKIPVTNDLIKQQRDKRTQVISYLTAEEASNAGFPNYIENYGVNQFGLDNCNTGMPNLSTTAGLVGEYYDNYLLQDLCRTKIDTTINIPDARTVSISGCGVEGQNKSMLWTGRLKAPVTGSYTIYTNSDDGVMLWLGNRDSPIINNYGLHAMMTNSYNVNLVAGDYYKIKMQYYNYQGYAAAQLLWAYPGKGIEIIPSKYLSILPPDSFKVNNTLTLENRVNDFRKSNHISEIDVLNADGRKYVYGIPVYNLEQKDVTFSVDGSRGNLTTGLAGYTPGVDNTTANANGKDNYFSSEQMPAYAHSFLLTSILSPDYVDITGNGITDDDMGDAVQFKYSKVCGIQNPYQWRIPYNDSVTFNEGLKTYSRDDKGSYSYGEKELWYLNSIESKNMIATFTLSDREDELTIDENGNKNTGGHVAKKLSEINLYNKVDFLKHGTAARPIKTVHFEYCYELCRGMNQPVNDSGKLTLKKIWFTYNGNNKGKKNPYIFNYHPNNPRYNTSCYDRWGNYKDPLQNPNSSSGHFVSNADYPYAIQDSAIAAYNAGAWALDSIKLPSGGAIKVDYESDDYAYVQNKRAMQMFQVVGFATSADTTYNAHLYENSSAPLPIASQDNLYVFVRVPVTPTSQQDAYYKYLEGLNELYFKVSVTMPGDEYGSGNEYVPGYAAIDTTIANWYYLIPGTNIIRIKVKGIDQNGNDGANSPLAEAAIQYLRLNLPSKAYPGSEGDDNQVLLQAVKMIVVGIPLMIAEMQSFDKVAKENLWARLTDTSRSYVRLNSPLYKKYGGGLRVKRITIYDDWNAMTGQQESTYGQEYSYTTTQEINGVQQTISSGVASYEPMMGNEENPFHLPVPANEKVAPLAPVTLGYVELPYGETFFPAASVGYSNVRVRSINYKNKRSANGYEETQFYTTYDFPTITDNSDITSLHYKPALSNFLRINAKNYLTASQGFKVELNDMNGKIKSEATYPETDSVNYISYTRNYYKVDDPSADQQHLSNSVWTINQLGIIDTTSTIGEDIELMTSMREQRTTTNGLDVSANVDMFNLPPPISAPVIIPSLIPMPQSEDMLYRAVATNKIIQRYGILDSVVHIDKGSKITTENLLYDGETGEVLLTRTKNEFEDPIYNFTYPAYWAYDGMAGAYKNIDLVLDHITMRNGKITAGLPYAGADTVYFTGGDELMVNSKQKTGGTDCAPTIATFPDYTKLWAVNSNELNDSAKAIYFIDVNGKPFTGNDISLKVTRSGRRNMNGTVGSVTTLANPLIKDTSINNYTLVFNTDSKVVNASAAEYKELWRVPEIKASQDITTCYDSTIDSSVENEMICDSGSYTWNGSTYTTSGTYTKHLAGSIGVDSIATLKLIIDTASSNDTSAIACKRFFWWGQEYDSSGTYSRLLYKPGGCPDTVFLHLNVLGHPQYATFCYYDNSLLTLPSHSYNGYTFNTGQISDSMLEGNIPILIQYANDSLGCAGQDSLYWTVYPVTNQDVNITVGCGQTGGPPQFIYDWTDGVDTALWSLPVVNDALSILSNAIDSNGCRIEKNLRIDSSSNIRVIITTDSCDGIDSGPNVSTPYSRTPDSCGFIDSSITIYHFTNHHYYDTIPASQAYFNWILNGESYAWSGEYIRYNYDSTCTDTLSLKALTNGIDTSVTACENGYTWPRDNVTYYRDTTVIYANDDVNNKRVDTLNLIVLPSRDTAYRDTICINTDTTISGHVYNSSIVKDSVILYPDTSEEGCISVDTVYLHFKNCGGGGFIKSSKEDNYVFDPVFDNSTGLNAVGAISRQKFREAIATYITEAAGLYSIVYDSLITTICATSQYCYNPLLNSTVNPYRFGLLGNFRANRSYVYYTTRTETDPTQPTNIRQDGTFKSFAPYWAFTSRGISPQQDTTKWVWNSELTMFNDKGFEIENKDPLGRYNSILYGYGKTLPVAVTQNSRYEENAFEGFEDYDYVGDRCDTACSPARHWDFSYYKYYIDSTQHHTGKYSIRIDPAVMNNIGIAAPVLPPPNEVAGITFNKGLDSCDTTHSTVTLTAIQATSNIVLPSFQPLPGKKMVFSAWVKEGVTCSCQSYTHNEVDIIPTDSSGANLDSIRTYPAGNIIEGWQRYEQVFTLPSNATHFSVVLRATDTSKVYFDDIRIHPFNANMKSFVYNSVNLRLVAELDENNYATFYEYDGDGTLVRVKKETERGIMTIQETRSALNKEQ
jgi:PA14 domain-containing protein